MENIEEIYKQYANLIKRYLFFVTRDIDLSEEIMQETFVVAIEQISKFRGDCEILTWLYSIAKKILYKKTKNSKTYISIERLEIEDNERVEEKCIENDSKIRLYEAIQKLDIDTRDVMYLRLTGDLTFKEIGKILNKSENWARVTFYRGKQKLKGGNII